MKLKKILLATLSFMMLAVVTVFNTNIAYADGPIGFIIRDVPNDEVILVSDPMVEYYVTYEADFYRVYNGPNIIYEHHGQDGALEITILNNTEVKVEDQNSGNYTTIDGGGTLYRIIRNYSTNQLELKMNNTLILTTDEVDGFYLSILFDNKVPVISGETTFVTNVNDEKPISFFLSYLSAYDETDGVVPVTLVPGSDNYTANKRVLGNHTFTVEASDSSGNKATAVINVRVVDIDAPTITGNTSVATIGYKETWNINNFKTTLNVSDNYDTLTHSDIGIKSDGYTSKKGTLGTYNVVFNVFDSSGNEGTFTKPVKVIDNVKPTFSGPVTISTSNTTILTESDVRSQLTASDEIDGNITNKIQLVEDNYTGKGNKVGSYTIVYSVADNAGNTATHTVTIQRIDQIPPIIWVVDGVSIRVTPTTPIDRETIIDILTATGQIQYSSTTTFSFPLDEYQGNEETPGIYAMSILSRSTNGNENVHSFSIQVLDVETDDGLIVVTEETWFQKNMTLVILVGVIVVAGVAIYIKRK